MTVYVGVDMRNDLVQRMARGGRRRGCVCSERRVSRPPGGLDDPEVRRAGRDALYDAPMKLAISLGACALICFVASASAGAAAPLVVWLGLSLAVLAGAYRLDRPGLLGKRDDGSRHAAATVVLLPW